MGDKLEIPAAGTVFKLVPDDIWNGIFGKPVKEEAETTGKPEEK